MGLVQAKLRVVTPLSGAGASAIAPFSDGIPVRFNPTEYSLTRNMSYAEVGIPGLSNPALQFLRGETQSLSLELYLDRSDRVAYVAPTAAGMAAEGAGAVGGATAATSSFEGVEAELNLLRLLVTIDSGLHAPPVVEFAWGKLAFRGVIASYGERFQMFDEKGQVLRARVTLTLKRYEPPLLQARALSRESPDRTKTRVVREGERLDGIAAEEYGDPAHWAVIARANGLARPRVLVAGSVLIRPPL